MGMVSTFLSCAGYNAANDTKRKEIQRKRLEKLVRYSRKNSPALAKLYKDVGADFSLHDLPVTTKQMIMDNYDEWVTDRSLKLADIKAFISDTGNVGKRFHNKYIVTTTSGSTGFPFIYLLNSESMNVISSEGIFAHEASKFPLVAVSPQNRFLILFGSVRENIRRFPFLPLFGLRCVDASLPVKQVVDQLEKIHPKTLHGPTSTICVIADECESRGIKLGIDEIMCGSELLTRQTREYLEETLGGHARNIYGCTEGGNIALECSHKHLHLHNGHVIIEPVDKDYNPVAPGEESDRILLTNLASYTVPIIRYEVTDRIVLHDEPCPCGNKSPWIEIEGRTASEPLVFTNGDSKIKISPFLIYIFLETLDTMRRFQLILHDNNRFECRIIFMPGVDEKAAFEEVKNIVSECLIKNGVENFSFYLSDTLPQIDPKTFKFKSIYQVSD